jgi:hypothetical protein
VHHDRVSSLEFTMVFTLFRAANAIFAVVIAIVIASRFGETATGKALTVLITSGVVALFEWMMTWAPKRYGWVRRLLDTRALFSSVWMQEVKLVYGSEGAKPDYPNRFAVFSVKYDQSRDNYRISGTAYTAEGKEHARWDSTDVVHFSKSGRSMSYQWEGTITNTVRDEDRAKGRDRDRDEADVEPGDPRRSGFASLELSSDDGGRGRVDHVAVNVILEFNFARITGEWLARNNIKDFKPDTLHDPAYRDAFAVALAKARTGRRAIGAGLGH